MTDNYQKLREMIIEANPSINQNEINYTTIYADELLNDVYVEIRKYPKRYFISYEDFRLDLYSGADIDQTYNPPTIIHKKILHSEFNLNQELEELKQFIITKL